MGTYLSQRHPGDSEPHDVNSEYPLSTEIVEPVRVGRTGDSEYVQVPGIGTGAAYSDGEAIGATITFPNLLRAETLSGQLYSATYLDIDKEALQVDLYLFKRVPTYAPSDNNTYAPTDADLVASGFVGVVSFLTFYSTSTSAVSVGTFSPIGFAGAAGTALYGQLVARGGLNIAANNLPQLRLVVLAD